MFTIDSFRSLQRLGPTVVALSLVLLPQGAAAQSPAAGAPQADPQIRIQVPTVTVTAQKEPEDKQKLPLSVTAVSADVLAGAGIRFVHEAAIFAPNTVFTESTARKLSTARFRGLSSSPGNPAITTYIDGVPQLNANTSSLEFVGVEQVEFVRGPQSALFGRNTLGGLVNITSARPSMSDWTGGLSVPFGTYGQLGVRGSLSGPVSDSLGLGVAFAQESRDGYTVNDLSGNDLDNRSAFSAKAQLVWLPDDAWEARVIVGGERARDGDYALHDLASVRDNPFHAARDFEGSVDRDVLNTTLQVRRAEGRFVFSSTTGFVDWRTRDVTDLDYTPLPIVTRANTEEAFQFTQELRLASSPSAPVSFGDSGKLRWQGGVFFFTQNYDQNAVNSYSPFVIAPFALDETSPNAALDDFGIGLFGQGTFAFTDRLEVTTGLRFDYEQKDARLESFTEPALGPVALVEGDESFSNVSPQVSVAYRIEDGRMLYGTVGRGFKAGGFNPVAPAGSEGYGEEHSWNVEGGLKTLWADGRVSANVAVFFIDWQDLQLNLPLPPTQFYIANVGSAESSGIEIELAARPMAGVDVFAAFGYTHARFSDGSISGGADVSGNKLPNTPDVTFSTGVQYSRPFSAATLVARADAVFTGAYEYDDLNTARQDAYGLVNLRLALTGRVWTGELLIRNAFDTDYVPFAFAYPFFAPSGFIGELGPPRTVSLNLGVRF